MPETQGITFPAILNKITTTIDGGWRITFDVNQTEAQQILELSELRGQLIQLGIVLN